MLQLTTERISVWFQNRRAKFKRSKKENVQQQDIVNRDQMEKQIDFLLHNEKEDENDEDNDAQNKNDESSNDSNLMRSDQKVLKNENFEERKRPKEEEQYKDYQASYQTNLFAPQHNQKPESRLPIIQVQSNENASIDQSNNEISKDDSAQSPARSSNESTRSQSRLG